MARALSVLLAVVVMAACAVRDPGPAVAVGGDTPTVAVERFLQLAAEEEYREMGYVFGTTSGPVIRRDDPGQVEQRMYAIALVLQHSEFSIQRESPVPGRGGAAIRVEARIVQRGEPIVVPFVTVQGPGGRWLVERVDLEAVTDRP
jgi:hypothetical protein